MHHWDQNWIEAYRLKQTNDLESSVTMKPDEVSASGQPMKKPWSYALSGFGWGAVLAGFLFWNDSTPVKMRSSSQALQSEGLTSESAAPEDFVPALTPKLQREPAKSGAALKPESKTQRQNLHRGAQ
jgi:hypothetical protein